MRFTLLTTLLALFALATAHIESITGPAKYKPTTNSNYPLTFNTANGPITNEDFSVAIGLAEGASTAGPASLVTFIKNYDLENTGKGSTGTGSFVLQVPLPKSRFSAGPGKYVIKAVVTNSVGASWFTQLLFFNTTITVRGV